MSHVQDGHSPVFLGGCGLHLVGKRGVEGHKCSDCPSLSALWVDGVGQLRIRIRGRVDLDAVGNQVLLPQLLDILLRLALVDLEDRNWIVGEHELSQELGELRVYRHSLDTEFFGDVGCCHQGTDEWR